MITRRLLQFIIFSVITTSAVMSHADNAWNDYHWATKESSFVLKVIDSTTTDWDNELIQSLVEWSQSAAVNLVIDSSDDTKKTRKRCKMVLGQMRVCNAAYGFNGWLGMATIGLDSNGHIDQGTAKMNDSYTSYWAIPGEKDHVACQEIGHVLALNHTTTDGSSQSSCMDYSADLSSQWPNTHDLNMLLSIYEHMDAYNSYDDGSGGDSGGDSGVCNAPPGKGCNKNNAEIPPMGFRIHRGEHHEIWVASRQDGGLWIHHLRLAPEGLPRH